MTEERIQKNLKEYALSIIKQWSISLGRPRSGEKNQAIGIISEMEKGIGKEQMNES